MFDECDICEGTGYLDCESCGGEGGWGSHIDNADIDICYWCQGSGQGDLCLACGGPCPDCLGRGCHGVDELNISFGQLYVEKCKTCKGRGSI